MNRFITGDKVSMQWAPAGGPGITLNIKGMTLDEECVIADVSHTGTNSRTARIAGKGDTKGSIQADFDLDLKPYTAPRSIRAGSLGVVVLGFDPAFPVQIPAIVAKVRYETAIENEVKYSFDYNENVLAGVIVYPAS